MKASERDSLFDSKLCSGCLMLSLKQPESFSPIQYKIMHSAGLRGLLPCRTLYFNGVQQLLYLSNGRQLLRDKLFNSPIQDCSELIVCLLNVVDGIAKSGYLPIANILFEPNAVYYNPSSKQVELLYLPIDAENAASTLNEVEALMGLLLLLLSGTELSKTFEWQMCLSGVKKQNGSLEVTCQYITTAMKELIKRKTVQKLQLTLVSQNLTPMQTFTIAEGEYLIGRDFSKVNGALPMCKTVSSVHCRIQLIGNKAGITDLSSRNGTYLNKMRLNSGQFYELHNGDRVMLANIAFQVIYQMEGLE